MDSCNGESSSNINSLTHNDDQFVVNPDIKRASGLLKLQDSLELYKKGGILVRPPHHRTINGTASEHTEESEEEQQGDDHKFSDDDKDDEQSNSSPPQDTTPTSNSYDFTCSRIIDWDEEEEEEEEDSEDDNIPSNNEEDVDLEDYFKPRDFSNLSVCERLLKQCHDEEEQASFDSDSSDNNIRRGRSRSVVRDEVPEEECGFVFCDDDNGDEEEDEEELPPSVASPFWYGFEDEEQMKSIVQHYYKALSLDEDRKRCIRQPAPFIGRIKRTKVDNEDIFTTLDEVTVFGRSIVLPGSEMPYQKSASLLTTWSYEDGIPDEIEIINGAEEEYWKERTEEQTQTFVFCLPVYESSTDYDYFVSEEDRDVTYSPSRKVVSQVLYKDVIPESLKFTKECEEKEQNGDDNFQN